MTKKFELVDMTDYEGRGTSYYVNTYDLAWFELMRFHKTKFVWYGVGQWSCHVMDWRGCNFWHGRLPKSPVFENPKDAVEWLYFQVENGAYKDGMELAGHHTSDPHCKKCNPPTEWLFEQRETNLTVYFSHVIGPTKHKISQRALLKKHERDLW